MTDDNFDPIYGEEIDNPYILGKTQYSLKSLYEWFMVRKCFINPMTNNLLNTIEQNDILDKFREQNWLPEMNYSKMSSHKIVGIMEKHKLHMDDIKRNEVKLIDLRNRLQENENKMVKARKKERYEKIIDSLNERIKKQEILLQNLKTIS